MYKYIYILHNIKDTKIATACLIYELERPVGPRLCDALPRIPKHWHRSRKGGLGDGFDPRGPDTWRDIWDERHMVQLRLDLASNALGFGPKMKREKQMNKKWTNWIHIRNCHGVTWGHKPWGAWTTSRCPCCPNLRELQVLHSRIEGCRNEKTVSFYFFLALKSSVKLQCQKLAETLAVAKHSKWKPKTPKTYR